MCTAAIGVLPVGHLTSKLNLESPVTNAIENAKLYEVLQSMFHEL